MFPFNNPNDIQSYMGNFKQPFGTGMPNGEDIQKMVYDSINQSMPNFAGNDQQQQQPQNRSSHSKKNSKPANQQVFETHDLVIARIPIDSTSNQRIQPRIFIDSHNLYIKDLPNESDDISIPLPVPVRPKVAKADYKKGILEVRMQKSGPEPLTEINMNET